ncbi:heterogeneous nuclear ribonucleoprotein Q [Punica granatum]|uniref:Heterogeneous nuclear ribonucleoprotein Q n=1 Tax=Punica granatum TaxID=22663 RepID=A0A6P8BQT0_PUNGR|nr:heterogeneous nuclear ribonucleoprotein Q [Punica granatum]
MAEGAEVEDRVDLDEDNYMEDVDEDIEEQLDDEGEGGGAKHDTDDNAEENDSKSESDGDDRSPEEEQSHAAAEPAEVEEERPTPSLNGDDMDKHAELLSLPPHGSEVFIGGLPRDVLEEDLRDLCEPIGEVFEVRLIKDKGTGESKGYAFVSFRTQEEAQKAIEELHSKEFKGKTLRCSLAESKNRLFIGNVPKSLKDDEFRKAIEEVGPGVENIELIKDPQNPSRNRGFAFVLYYNNACADYSRQKMSNANFKLDGNTPTVTWADPKSAPDHSAASQVKALYVKNIPENTTTEQLKELFQRHGEVVKVVMPPSKSGSNKRDFGFVHYAERSSALKAVKDSEKYEIDGHALEVVLAKPQSEKKPDIYNSGLHANPLPNAGYGGFVSSPFGPPHTGYGGVSSSFQQPVIYGRGPMPSGMHMVPMVLPDGRIGYVLQQPGVQMPHPRPRRIDNRNGQAGRGGGVGGSGSEEGNRSRRYRPY